MAKVREIRHSLAGIALSLLVGHDFRFFELPSPGSFHLSLAVLVHYRSTGSIQAYGMVPARFRQDCTCPVLLDCRSAQTRSATGLSPSVARFPDGSPTGSESKCGPSTPTQCCGGLPVPAFARHLLAKSRCFLFLEVLRCFTSSASPRAYGFSSGTAAYPPWVPHSDIADQSWLALPTLFAAPRPSSPPVA